MHRFCNTQAYKFIIEFFNKYFFIFIKYIWLKICLCLMQRYKKTVNIFLYKLYPK